MVNGDCEEFCSQNEYPSPWVASRNSELKPMLVCFCLQTSENSKRQKTMKLCCASGLHLSDTQEANQSSYK